MEDPSFLVRILERRTLSGDEDEDEDNEWLLGRKKETQVDVVWWLL